MTALQMKIREFRHTEHRPALLVIMALCGATLLISIFAFQGVWTIVPSIVLMLLLAMIAWPEAATLVFMFIIYMNIPVVATKFHDVPQFFAAASVLILVVPMASLIIMHRKPFVSTPGLVLLLIYFFIMLVSSVFSLSVGTSMDVFQTYVTEGLALYFLVTNVVRTPATLRRVVWVLIIACSLMGALSIFQEVTKTYSNNYWGFAQVDGGGFSVADGLEGKLFRLRLAGPIGEKNRYAQAMLAIFPLALFRIWGEKSHLLKALAGGATLLILSGVLLSFSRGAAVAMIGLLVITTLWGYIRVHQAIFVVLVLALLIAVVAPDFVVRLDSLRGVTGLFSEEGDKADGAIVGRETSNLAALHVFLDYPILGVGPGQYYKQYSQQYANALGLRFFDVNRRAHNMYLETAADLGIIGLSGLLAIFIVPMIQLDKLRRYWSQRYPPYANMVTAFLLSMISYMATAVFLHLSYLRYVALLWALANSAIYIARSQVESEETLRSEHAPGNVGSTATVLVPDAQ